MDRPLEVNRNSEEDANRFSPDNWSKSLQKINSILLLEPSGDETSLVARGSGWSARLQFINPFG